MSTKIEPRFRMKFGERGAVRLYRNDQYQATWIMVGIQAADPTIPVAILASGRERMELPFKSDRLSAARKCLEGARERSDFGALSRLARGAGALEGGSPS